MQGRSSRADGNTMTKPTEAKQLSIMLGCMDQTAVYRSRGRGRFAIPEHKTWRHSFRVPEHGHNKDSITCPFCHGSFQLSVYSKSKARIRKAMFVSSFFAVAACGIVLGVFAGGRTAFVGLSLAAPFVIFAVWQLLNVFRGKFDPSDIVAHARGKVHRIYDDHKITFSDD